MAGIISNTGMGTILLTAFKQTFYMVFWSTLFSVILGFIPAIVLTLTAPDGLKPNKIVYETLSFIVNVFRSFPFIILYEICAASNKYLSLWHHYPNYTTLTLCPAALSSLFMIA